MNDRLKAHINALLLQRGSLYYLYQIHSYDGDINEADRDLKEIDEIDKEIQRQLGVDDVNEWLAHRFGF